MYHLRIIQCLLKHRNRLHLDTLPSAQSSHDYTLGIDDLEDAFEGFMVERDQVMWVELLLLKVGTVHNVAKPSEYLNSASRGDHVVLFQGQ